MPDRAVWAMVRLMDGNGPGRFGRRAVLAFLLCGAANIARAEAPARSSRPIRKPGDAARRAAPQADRLVSAANLGGKTSFAVADVNTGEVLETFNPVLAHPPASTAKALTTFYAIEALGPDHRFLTRVLATGPIEEGILKGDLALCGGGNPVLDSRDLLALAGQLKELGIIEVTGKLLVFDEVLPEVALIDKGQPDHVSYNPGLSGLNLNFNRVFLEWKKVGDKYSISMEARANSLRPAVGFASAAVVDRRGPVFTYETKGQREIWTVARGALGNDGGRWLPVRNPRIYAGEVFQTVARSHGLKLPYPKVVSALPKGKIMATHESPPLVDICFDMMKFSTNLTAEVIGMMATRARGRETGLPQSGQAMSDWMRAQHGARKPALVDHSGLGDRSQLTAVDMVKSLISSGARAVLHPLMKPVVLARNEGDRQPDPTLKVVAKTGTLNFVSGLAGYITTPGGRELAFAVFSSDLERRAGIPRENRERPRGSRGWNNQSRRMQRELIRRWSVVHELQL